MVVYLLFLSLGESLKGPVWQLNGELNGGKNGIAKPCAKNEWHKKASSGAGSVSGHQKFRRPKILAFGGATLNV